MGQSGRVAGGSSAYSGAANHLAWIYCMSRSSVWIASCQLNCRQHAVGRPRSSTGAARSAADGGGRMIVAAIGCSLAEGDADRAAQRRATDGTQIACRVRPARTSAHAHNPVDWYPWAPSAEKRRKIKRSSCRLQRCHYCHVMEKLAFSNSEIARYMNEHFVNIGRPRRTPRLDDIYMTACRCTFIAARRKPAAGHCHFWLDGRPIAEDVFPAGRRTRRVSLLLKKVVASWRNEHSRWRAMPTSWPATRASEARSRQDRPGDQNLQETRRRLRRVGFSPAPESPEVSAAVELSLLRYQAAATPIGQPDAILHARPHVGRRIYDHVGGGFRYSTDRFWRIPLRKDAL